MVLSDRSGVLLRNTSIVFTTESLEHLRGVEIAVHWTSGTCECFVGFVNLAETAIRETEVVQNRSSVGASFAAASNDRSQLGSSVLIQREAEVVQRVGVFFEFHSAFERLLGAIAETLLVVGDAQKVVRFGKSSDRAKRPTRVQKRLRYNDLREDIPCPLPGVHALSQTPFLSCLSGARLRSCDADIQTARHLSRSCDGSCFVVAAAKQFPKALNGAAKTLTTLFPPLSSAVDRACLRP